MKKKICILLAAISLGACSEKDPPKKADCVETTACSEEQKTLFVSILHKKDSTPVALDNFEVLLLPEGKALKTNYSDESISVFKSTGLYPVIADKDKSLYKPKSLISLVFKGYRTGKPEISTDIFVTFDCCHAQWVGGKEEIYIE